MQIKEVATEGLRRDYAVTVDAEAIEANMNARLQEVGKNAKIPGFRPGKVPSHILKQRYGQSVMGEVLEQTINKSTQQVIQEKDLRPVMAPKIEVKSFDEGKALEFEMSVELFPEIPETDFTKLKLERHTFEVAEKDVDEGLERLAGSQPELKPVEKKRAAKLGDVAVIDFLGKLDGTPFDGGKGEKFSLELGSGQFIPGFEDQVVGVKPGEDKVITVTFPEDYHSEELKGKEVTFDIHLHELQERVTPEVNDEFATKLGFKSLEELREKVKEQIASDYESLVRTQLKKHLFDVLDEQLEFDLPQTMVEQEFATIWEKVEKAKKDGDESLDKPEEELREEYQAVAERRVRLGLLLAEVSRLNKLTVSQDEIRKAVFDQARMFPGQEQKVIEFYQQNPNHVQELQGPLLEEKAVDLILEKVSYTDKQVSLEELVELANAAEEAPAKPKKAAKKKPAANKPAAKKAADAKADDAEKKAAPKKTAAKKKSA